MPLLDSDIQRIMGLGHAYDEFIIEVKGWLQLRNRDGLCVFHNGNECRIYDARPEGCRNYPLLYDEDTGVVLDHDCPHWEEVELDKRDRESVVALVVRLRKEKKDR